MHTHSLFENYASLIASAAEVSIKPWKYAVLPLDHNSNLINDDELLVKIECRDLDGKRLKDNDIELEIFASGSELNLMISWCSRSDHPILWHGKHSVWMDPNTGERCSSPLDGRSLESFARRLRALFPHSNKR